MQSIDRAFKVKNDFEIDHGKEFDWHFAQ